jgi:hypothetical protein
MSRSPEELEYENHTGAAELVGGLVMAFASAELIPDNQLGLAFVVGGLYAVASGIRRCWESRPEQ